VTDISTRREVLSRPGEGKAWWFLETLALVRTPAGAPRVPTVIELTVPPGGSPPLHVHDHLDDSFLLLDGRVAMRCGEATFGAEPGAYVSVPAGVPHTFRVTSRRPARMMLVHNDDSFLRLVETLGEPAAEARLPRPDETRTEDLEAIMQASSENDAAIIGESMSEAESNELVERPAFEGVDHVALEVRNLRVSQEWYCGALGLERVDGHVADDGTGHVTLLHPGTGTIFALSGTRAGAGVDHVALGCAGREELVRWQARLLEQGLGPGTITDAPYGSGFVVRDPDGTQIELFTRTV
jgi:mannose-6-phosphate isomerase-like protein (cupin superfamily)/catechol 2,3-dioxygenase-like lactoylglutathione lyase family enzyme